jgi:hypothetical protein
VIDDVALFICKLTDEEDFDDEDHLQCVIEEEFDIKTDSVFFDRVLARIQEWNEVVS